MADTSNAELVRQFHTFLEGADADGVYLRQIRTMIRDKKKRLLVDLNDLRTFDKDLTRRLLADPHLHIPAIEKALRDIVMDNEPAYLTDDKDTVHIGFTGTIGRNLVSPRTLTSNFLTKMVCVEGIVTRCSLVRPKIVQSVHYCPATKKFSQRDYRDATDWDAAGPTGTTYPTKDENGNPLETEFGLCTYKAHQTVTLQEMPERAPLGQLPRSTEIVLSYDLVDAAKPGDRVQIFGVYRALAGGGGAVSGVFRTVLLANSVIILTKGIESVEITPEDVTEIRNMAKNKDIFELMAQSMAPSIFGHEYMKKAVLLMLLGGKELVLANGTHLRGDINILMVRDGLTNCPQYHMLYQVGDPSTAKSQMLRFVLSIAPLAVNTTGRGSSGVGLTAAITTDPETHERRLEAGAMVLADRGVVCIDEFDKMSDVDRVAIHEVMEQQTVTIAKAGMHASLNARCSVVAAANPIYGQYDKTATPQKNVGLPDSLLSRFDMLFIVLDELSSEHDKKIATHVLNVHRYERPNYEGVPIPLDAAELPAEDADNGGEDRVYAKYNPLLFPAAAGEKRGKRVQLLSLDFIKKYIMFAKTRVQPTLTDRAREIIAVEYNALRQKQDNKTMPVTARLLETLIRLSTAHAKCHLSAKILPQHVEAAVAILKFALYHEAEPVKKRRRDGDDDADGDEEKGKTLSDDDEDDEYNAAKSPSASKRARSARASPRKAVSPAKPKPAPAAAKKKPAAGGAAAGAADDADAVSDAESDVDMDGADDADGADGAAAGTFDVDDKSERFALVRNAVANMFRRLRQPAYAVASLLEEVNKSLSPTMPRGELLAILKKLQDDNRVMVIEGIVHQI